MTKLVGIVAMTPERIIGASGSLPWHLPADLAFFKRTTSGHPVVMGRKTYESIGRPLPDRRNLVMTRDASWHASGAEIIRDIRDLNGMMIHDPVIFIIGGSEIYRVFLPHLDELLITHVHKKHSGDTVFPEFEHAFRPAETLESHPEFTVRRWIKINRF